MSRGILAALRCLRPTRILDGEGNDDNNSGVNEPAVLRGGGGGGDSGERVGARAAARAAAGTEAPVNICLSRLRLQLFVMNGSGRALRHTSDRAVMV